MGRSRDVLAEAWAKRNAMREKAESMRSIEGHILVDGYKLMASADLWWGVAVSTVHGNTTLYWDLEGGCTVKGRHFLAE